MVANATSVIEFDRSQERLFLDPSRVIVVNWHRQKGKDFTASAKAVDDALRTGDSWFIISLTQRQADETFRKCLAVAKLFKRLLKIVAKDTINEWQYSEFDRWIDKSLTWTAREITFPNGGRVVSLPGRDPDTLAGLTGNLILTEFGLFPNGGHHHWSVLFPIITRGKYKVIVISTPRGKNHKFYELFNAPDTYSVHFCDIYQSVEQEGYILRDQQGKPCSIEAFRKLYNDESKWPREYECKFTGDLEALLSFAQVQRAGELGVDQPFAWLCVEGDNLGELCPAWFTAGGLWRGRGELGWDVARTGHLSSLWCNEAIPGRFKNLRRLVLMHRTSFALQREIVNMAMNAAPRSVGVGDATGLGMDSNETLSTRYTANRWMSFNFGGSGKSELGSVGYTTFDGGGQAIPPHAGSAGFIASDLMAVQADRSTDKVKLDEGLNPQLPESHCDIAYSCFLSERAGALAGQVGGLITL